jgi:hypothetical protein
MPPIRLHEIPCPANNETCEYRETPEGCRLTKHHIYPKRLGETALELAFIRDPRNHVRACRKIHDTLDRLPPYTLPSEEDMREFLPHGERYEHTEADNGG